jgi:acyl-CoA thioesterase
MAEPYQFDQDVAVTATEDGRWRGTMTDRWNVGPTPNGGYQVAIALAALRQIVRHPDPLAVSAHFMARAEPGPVEVEAAIERSGRRHSTASARLVQSGERRLHVAATFGDLSVPTGPTLTAGVPPVLPRVEGCFPQVGHPLLPEIMRRFDLRLTAGSLVWATGKPRGVGEMAGWIRFADDREPDAAALILFADALPPAVFNLAGMRAAPTVQLTVHVRSRPSPGWLRCRFVTRHVTDGYLEEDGEIWDAAGKLVALSRQLRRLQ